MRYFGARLVRVSLPFQVTGTWKPLWVMTAASGLAAAEHRVLFIFFRRMHGDLQAAQKGNGKVVKSKERVPVQFIDDGGESAAVELAGLNGSGGGGQQCTAYG